MNAEAILRGLHQLKEKSFADSDRRCLEVYECADNLPIRLKCKLEEELNGFNVLSYTEVLDTEEASIIWEQYKRTIALLFFTSVKDEGLAFQNEVNRSLAAAINDLYALAVTITRTAQMFREDFSWGVGNENAFSLYDSLSQMWLALKDGGETEGDTFIYAGFYMAIIEFHTLFEKISSLELPQITATIDGESLQRGFRETIQELLNQHFNTCQTKGANAARKVIVAQFSYLMKSFPEAGLVTLQRSFAESRQLKEAGDSAPVITVCPNCGSSIEPGWKFCGKCRCNLSLN